MDIIKSKFGERLKIIRNLKGLTQEVLAEKIGINWRQLVRIEAGESFIKSDTLYKICNILKITPNVLFDFAIQNEILMTGTDNKVYFNVIKSENVIKLIPENEIKHSLNESSIKEINSNFFDNKMIFIAQKLKKDIVVNENHNNININTKIYSPNGNIEIVKNESEKTKGNKLELLFNKIKNLSDNEKQLKYIELAIDSLSNKNARKELKTLINGMELLE